MSAAPMPLKAAERTVTLVGAPMFCAPSPVVSVTDIVNVPDARASTANGWVLVPTGSSTACSFPSGNRSFSLSSRTRTVTGFPERFSKLSGTLARRAVSVTRRSVVKTVGRAR